MAQAPLTKEERQARDAQELRVWEPLRAAGEAVQRERRATAAVKAREDGVEPEKQERGKTVVLKV